jgi:4-diphosphocytidyl-2-C-methyl-D-erythritol kinase
VPEAWVSEFAPAKVNLYLHVTGRRADGYHLLDSLAVFPAVGDRLRATPAEALSLTIEGPFGAALADEPDNLVLRAARALGGTAGARIVLEKHLPVASGIGGGSADAAAALRLLCRLWGLPLAAPPVAPAGAASASIASVPVGLATPELGPAALAPSGLAPIALALGADVPVCLASRAARMGGVGETLTPAPGLPPAGMVLVNPGVALSTAEVFRARTAEFSAPAALPASWPDAAAMANDLLKLRNDLQPPAIALCPVIGVVLSALAAVPGCLLARMSGSGGTCFGLFRDAPTAEAAARALARPGWWCWGGALDTP